MFLDYILRISFLRDFLELLGRQRANDLADMSQSFLKDKKGKILDVGSGGCQVLSIYKKEGYDITGIDVQNISLVKDVKPIIYNGKEIPFKNDSFDSSLILTVLHHTPKPEDILKEAMRVSNQIIIIEDIYHTTIQKYLTFFFDCILNFEFFGHPHTNKSDKQWRETFEELGLNLTGFQQKQYWGVFTLGIYSVEKK